MPKTLLARQQPTSAPSAPGSSSPPTAARPARSMARRWSRRRCSTNRFGPGLPALLQQQTARPRGGPGGPVRDRARRQNRFTQRRRPAGDLRRVPDAPVTKFVLNMEGGKKGLLVNSSNLCKTPRRPRSDGRARTGPITNTEKKLQTACGGSASKHRKRSSGPGRGR